jgi:ComF family protein
MRALVRPPATVDKGAMATAWRRMLDDGVAFALPPRCPGCGAIVEGDHRFCGPCWTALDWLSDPLCDACGVPLPLGPGSCEPCHRAPPRFDRARAAVAYGEIARRVVLKLKHGNRPGVARTLAAAMARLTADTPADALLAAVPLHRWRLWRRGYNQSLLIAQALARETRLTCVPDLLVRTRATPMLGGLGRKARADAVRGVFAVPDRHRVALAGRVVVLVDDVLTTGATAEACAEELKRAGAASVWLVTWARVIRDEEPR